jgi:hypothetical protein
MGSGELPSPDLTMSVACDQMTIIKTANHSTNESVQKHLDSIDRGFCLVPACQEIVFAYQP